MSEQAFLSLAALTGWQVRRYKKSRDDISVDQRSVAASTWTLRWLSRD